MRRVLRYLHWYRRHWEDLAGFEAELDPAGRAGLRAYALRQAHLFGRLRAAFHVAWSAGSGKAVVGNDLGVVQEGEDQST